MQLIQEPLELFEREKLVGVLPQDQLQVPHNHLVRRQQAVAETLGAPDLGTRDPVSL
ncbi:hypothetical protein D3C78_1896640 [compost metagenome]